ncbi:unnamed protein product [Ectocarpus sp. CCAP 1310/34]|nr:unnamed protein product [Ectocarpus sp. CCAP 1310/34]
MVMGISNLAVPKTQKGDESGGPDSDTLLSSSLPSGASSTGKKNQQDASANSPRRSPTGGGIRGKGQHHRGAGESGQGTSQGTGDSGRKADRLAASISQALKDAGLNDGRTVKPSDMLRFGMGLGITLGANGLLGELDGSGKSGITGASPGGGGGTRSGPWNGEEIEGTGGVEAWLAPPVVKVGLLHKGFGHGHTEPVAKKEDSAVLDHKSEAEHLASIVRNSADLKTSEEFKGLLVGRDSLLVSLCEKIYLAKQPPPAGSLESNIVGRSAPREKLLGKVVVPPPEPTPCPDEDYGMVNPEDMEADPRRKAELSIPIIAYPETLWKKQYRGHGAAGEGQSWQPAGGDRAANQRAKSSLGVPMRRTNEKLPEGFLNAISHTHVGKQHCDYLPHVPNMPQARAVGRVKPRSAAEDWFAVGFDPWSAGREPLSAEFIPSLSIKQGDLGGDEDGGGVSTVPQTGYLELKDSAGHAEMAIVSAEEVGLAAAY